MRTDEDTGAAPRGGQHRCSSLLSNLLAVPYAGQNPPMLVGGALCRAEPSITRDGRGPVAKPPVMGPAASARRGSQTALSKPPTGRCPEPLVGGALCRAEPSIIGGCRDLQVKPPVRWPPGARSPTKWPAACADLNTGPGENTRGARS